LWNWKNKWTIERDEMKFGSLFSGIGGFDLGFERAGMECVWQCEIDPKASEVLAKHWPNVKRYSDVREIGKHNLEPVDVICGGFPCQDLSIAGKRAGLAGGRSGLWFEFARIIDEIEPKWVVIENVPGLLSSNSGKDFAVLLRWLVERGYGVCWRVLDSQYFGVAQRRRRVFIVASFGSGRSAEVLFESEGLSWDTPTRGETGQGTAGTFTVRSGSDGGGKGYLGLDDGAMTLGGQPQWVTGVMSSGQANAEITEDVSPTLNLLHEAPICWEMQHASEAYRESGDIAPNLQARMGTGGNNVPCVGVRRLTPTECSRLQGFPDDWNSFQADSSRYKQYGNAVTVNVAEWIGRRLEKVTNDMTKVTTPD
jgi:DNA (cytosine-5)-methyltransferase 1